MKTQVNGYPVYVEYRFWPGSPFRQTGWGAGDCEPEEYDEVEVIDVTDESGASVFKWISDADTYRIEHECIQYHKTEVAA